MHAFPDLMSWAHFKLCKKKQNKIQVDGFEGEEKNNLGMNACVCYVLM